MEGAVARNMMAATRVQWMLLLFVKLMEVTGAVDMEAVIRLLEVVPNSVVSTD
jgi:hypothetical protein